MSSSRLEALHAQLGTLLENAQFLLASDNSYYGGNVGGVHALSSTGPKALVAPPAVYSFVAMQAEIRTLEFWRSIIAECIATFFYCMIVLSVATSSPEHTLQTNSAVAAGLAMVMLTACFARVSGCHANPAVTVGMTLAKHVSPLRAVLYMCAQCGGAIAGAALVLGVHGKIADPALTPGGGTFGMEFVLTFLVMYAFCASRDSNPSRSSSSSLYNRPQPVPGNVRADAVVVGIAYAACLICWRGSLNPARALGSAFVSRSQGRFLQHWVFWVGPLLGAVTGAFAYEYIFNTRRRSFAAAFGKPGGPHDLEQVSVRSEDDMLDDLERAKQYKANIIQDFQDQSSASAYSAAAARGGAYNKRLGVGGSVGPTSMEPVYGGTKSMFNQPVSYDRYQDGSKSCYSGYDGGVDSRSAINLRRSRSIHAKFPGSTTTPGMTRRNPYDYLPDEPSVQAKPDIMQSSIVTENGTSRLMGNKSSPRYGDNYANEKLAADAYESSGIYGGSSSRGKDEYDYKRPYSTTASGQAAVMSSGSAEVGHFGQQQQLASSSQQQQGVNRGDFQRMSRMRSEFYSSPQYNASYSQQNGCSITTNSNAAAAAAAAVGGGYHSNAANY